MDRAAIALRAERAPAVPTVLALALAARRGRRSWDVPELRERSLRAMEPLAGDPAQHQALARRHRVIDTVRDSLVWRPWVHDRAPLHGAGAIAAALGSGRGVLGAYCHFGYFGAMPRSLVRLGVPVHLITGPWLLDPPPADWRGERAVRRRAVLEEAGVSLVPAEGCFDRVVGLLRAGAIVCTTVDAPGSVATTLLGLRATVSSGPARMAAEADAIVVPLLRPPVRTGLSTIAGAPLDTRSFAGWEQLHHAVAAVHEAWMRSAPWAHEMPSRLVGGD